MFGLDVDTLRDMRQLFRQFSDIEKVILYGSRAKGNYRKGSDIDITLIGKGLGLDNAIDPLMRKLDDLNLPYTFDISIFKQLDNLDLIDHILRVGKPFYEKEESIPEGWEEKKLKNIITLEYGKPLQINVRNPNGKFPVYGANGIKTKTNKFLYNQSSIIIGRKGSAGEINLSESKFWPLDVTYYTVFDSSKYDLKFLYYYMSNLDLTKFAKGVKPGINRNDIYNLRIQIPSLLAIQKQIVANLDRAFEAIDRAIKNTEQNLKNCQELFDSNLHDVFSNDCWPVVQLGELCRPEYGYTTSAKDFGKYRFVRITDINDNGLLKSENKKYILPKESVQKFILKKLDVLVVRTGATYGKVLLFDNSEPSVFASYLIRLCFSKDRVNHKFYWCFSQSKAYWNQVQSLVSGAGQPQFNANAIVKIKIPLPSLDIQKQIVNKFDKFNRENKELKFLYEQKIESLKELKKSILQQAFNCKSEIQ